MSENFQYDRINDGVKILKYIGAAEIVTIPATLKNLPVVEIGNKAFFACDWVKSVEIPDSVKVIAADAFYGCDNLTLNISFSAKVKFGNIFIKPKFIQDAPPPTDSKYFSLQIYNNTVYFTYIGTDSSVSIPSMLGNLPVVKISSNAFSKCESLKEVYIPDSVTEIDAWAFDSCINLNKIYIPNSVTTIRWGAFNNCYSLKKITIPVLVTELEGVFQGCGSLTEINIPDYVKKIGGQTFCGCGMTEIYIPDSVTEIGYHAFSGCRSLTEIYIPDSVKEIGKYAFSDCISLKEISLPAGIKIAENAFYNCPAKIIYRDKK